MKKATREQRRKYNIQLQEDREVAFKEYSERVRLFDNTLPNFFAQCFVMYSQEELQKTEIDFISILIFSKDRLITILKRFYPEELQQIDLVNLYYLSEILNYFFLGLYSIHFKINMPQYIEDITFEFLFMELEPYFDEHFGYEEKDDERFDEEDKERWSLSTDEYYDIPDSIDSIRKTSSFVQKDNSVNKKVYSDYFYKWSNLFFAITDPHVSKIKRQTWSKDFVDISELLLQNRYLLDDEIVELNNTEINNSDGYDNKLLMGFLRSYESVFIYYVNCVENRNQDALLKLARMAYLTITNIYEQEPIDETVFDLDTIGLLNLNYQYAADILEECKEENTFGIRMDCLPKYMNSGIISNFAPHHNIMNNYLDDIENYCTEVITIQERDELKIAVEVLNAGVEREDFKAYINDYREKYRNFEKYLATYNKMYELGLIQQIFYLLSDALMLFDLDDSGLSNIKRLCSRIQDYVYTDRAFTNIEQEMDGYTSRRLEKADLEFEVNLHQRYLYMLDAELDEDTSIEKMIELRQSFINQVLNDAINTETIELIERINDKVLKLIESKIRNEELFNNISKQVRTYVESYKEGVITRIKNYLGNEGNADSKYENIIQILTTAEFLYKRYVVEKAEYENDFDYSCVALEYYLALEELANMLLYVPYREKILQPKYCNNKGLTEKNFDGYMKGFVGRGSKASLFVKNFGFKESLELGGLAFVYKDAYTDENKLKSEFAEVSKYIQDLNLDFETVVKLAGKLYEIRKLRNESAHGGKILDIKKAYKAQDVSYIHFPVPDHACQIKTADECHAIIIEFLKWFA